MRLVRTGKTYDLGVELNSESPGVPGFAPFMLAFTHTPEMTAPHGFSFAGEMVSGVSMPVPTSTRWSTFRPTAASLAVPRPAGRARIVAGWNRASRRCRRHRPRRASGRGGSRRVGRLTDGEEIGVDEVEALLRSKHLTIGRGDIVLVRTGKISQWSDPVAFNAGAPGLGREPATHLYDAGMAVLGTDTAAVEPTPFKDPRNTLHRAMLVEAGVHLIENLDLEGVCRDGVAEGLFVALPLKFTGATGSWLRPVIIT